MDSLCLYDLVTGRGSQPGGLERYQISDLLGTFVSVGGRNWG